MFLFYIKLQGNKYYTEQIVKRVEYENIFGENSTKNYQCSC